MSDGALASQAATISVTVTPVNDNPVAVNDQFTLNEDNALTIPPSQLLVNDSDIAGNARGSKFL